MKAAYGWLPWSEGPLQVARDAEDFAVMQEGRLAIGSIVLHVDCAGTVDALLAGPGPLSGGDRAHIWGRTWTYLDPADAARTTKVKAHSTQADVDSGATEPWQKLGNDSADEFAKRGAALHTQGSSDDLSVAVVESFQ